VRWQRLPTLKSSAPFISLADTFKDLEEVVGFVSCKVYCPEDVKAVLVSSISQRGIIYLNGREVFRDELEILSNVVDRDFLSVPLER